MQPDQHSCPSSTESQNHLQRNIKKIWLCVKKINNIFMIGLFVCVLPSSWGNSSQKMAIEVLKPVRRERVKDAPMARPSMKLCTASLTVIIHATVFILDIPSPFSQWQVNNTHAFCTNWKENRHWLIILTHGNKAKNATQNAIVS